jgi:hypothetical protein
MLTALVLICSLTATPDFAACNRDNAIDVVRVPEEFTNPTACFMKGQAYIAQTGVGRALAAGEGLKVVCSRDKQAGAQE